MVLVQKSPFFQLLFFGKYRPGKCLLRYSRTKKTHVQPIKNKSKSRKIDIFPKGLTYGFGPRMASFSLFFRQYRPGKCLLRYNTTTKNSFLGYKNNNFKQTKKIDIFPKGLTHGLNQKMAIFLTFFFQAMQGRKMSVTIFQNKKTTFQTIKTRSSSSRKIHIFSKGLTHRFGPKMAILPTFFRQAIYASKMSFTIFQREKTLLQAMKKKKFKKSKN